MSHPSEGQAEEKLITEPRKKAKSKSPGNAWSMRSEIRQVPSEMLSFTQRVYADPCLCPPLHPHPWRGGPEQASSWEPSTSPCSDSAFKIPSAQDGSGLGVGRHLPLPTLWVEYLQPGSPRGKLRRAATVWQGGPVHTLPRPCHHQGNSSLLRSGGKAYDGWRTACLSTMQETANSLWRQHPGFSK